MRSVSFVIIFFFLATILFSQTNQDQVKGNLIQFNDNGAWCWYQDERAVVDKVKNMLILGSDASGLGTGGSDRNGNIEGIIYDLNTRSEQKTVFWKPGCDDHNVPGFIIRPDGKYLTMYAEHYDYYNSHYRIYDAQTWSEENLFDWETTPGGGTYTIAYSNLYYLADESRMYNFARANYRTPNFIISDDYGDTWSFGGQLSTNNTNSYNKGYYKYWGNGKDRIDFICTEEHPRDGLTSMYHGFIMDGKVFDSDSVVVDDDIYTTDYIPTFLDFTQIFADNTEIDGNYMRKIWNADLMRYDDGTIAAILTARINDATNGNDTSIDPDHAFIYCRYNGSTWSYTYLGQAGKKMYSSEADYTGLGALHPNNSNVICISTHVDPRTDEDITYREIFKGVTDDEGVTWTWLPITQNSNQHNFRPIIPLWDDDHTALLWFRGTYNAAQNFNSAIVGLIETSNEHLSEQIYADADVSNTTFADGSSLSTTGPDAEQGADDDQWHIRTGWGNGGSVLTSSEIGGEDAPALRTQITVSDTGRFDVWVNFWANPEGDWRIKAGLSQNGMQIFRQMACKQVEDGDHQTTLVLSGTSNTYLYQAYLGRVHLTDSETIDVYVDDHSIETGSTSTRIGNTARTWYDGISYASLEYNATGIEDVEMPNTIILHQNYPNPFNPVTTISYAVGTNDYSSARIDLSIYNILGQQIATLVSENQKPGQYSITWNATEFASGIYFYQLKADDNMIKTRKMMLIR